MHDINAIRQDPEAFDAALAKRGADAAAAGLLAKDEERRAAIATAQELQTRRNEASKQIGRAKGQGDEDEAQRLMAEVAGLKDALHEAEEAERRINAELTGLLAAIPNLPLDDVPAGADESGNVEIRKHGTPREGGPEHFEIGETLGMDFEAAARLSGSRFVVLRHELARLERALGNFMLDLHTQEHGYTEMAMPVLVRDDAMFGTGQLPKFAEDSFHTDNGYWLTPTSEVSLTNLVREQITDAATLPLRFTAQTLCFRSEAGAAGRDTRGMIRQHQFAKVELVSVVDGETGEAELERKTQCAEEVLKRLELPYRVMLLCSGDMGFGARKTYDLEVWLPGQNAYREISSISYCGDFQGPPDECPHPRRGREADPFRAHAERLRSGHRPHAGGGVGKLCTGRRQRHGSDGSAALYGRR